jgi:hypothetical protein
LFKFFSKAKVLYKKLFKANPPPLTHHIIELKVQRLVLT